MSARPALVCATLVLAVAGCAGAPTKRSAPARDVGHGSVEEVVTALALERLPCSSPTNEALDGFEQVVSCSIGTNRITIVHYADPATQAAAYEQKLRDEGAHGVFAVSWAAKVPTASLAKRIGTALVSTGYV